MRQKLVILFRKLATKSRRQEIQSYPTLNFEEKHIKNCKLLIDRTALLESLPKNKVIAEIGVFKGDFSKSILNICNPKKLYLIDIWKTTRYNEKHYNIVRKNFAAEIIDNKIEIIRALSFEGISSLPDQYLDWVYLDTDHSLETTRKELNLLLPKMRDGGIIAGHDYIQGSWVNGIKYGVIESIREFCIKHNWELIYLTNELDNHPSFAIREITD